jgi:hypothetical protein
MSTSSSSSSVSLSLLDVAKTQFTLAVQIAIDALMNKCGYSRERATTALLKELNRSSSTSTSTSSSTNNVGSTSNNNNNNNNNNKPTDDEVRIVSYRVLILNTQYLTIVLKLSFFVCVCVCVVFLPRQVNESQLN